MAKADPEPNELIVPANRVGTVIEHIYDLTRAEPAVIRANLLGGKVRMLGIPLRVINGR